MLKYNRNRNVALLSAEKNTTGLYCRKEEDKMRLDYCLRTLSSGISIDTPVNKNINQSEK